MRFHKPSIVPTLLVGTFTLSMISFTLIVTYVVFFDLTQ